MSLNTILNDSGSSSSSTSRHATTGTSGDTSRQCMLLSPGDTIFQTLDNETLFESRELEPLFQPAGAERTWYMGFIKEWKDFNYQAARFRNSPMYRGAFNEIIDQPMAPPAAADQQVIADNCGPEILTSYFQRHILDTVQLIYNKLLQTPAMRNHNVPYGLVLSKSSDEDLGNTECEWNPTFVVKAKLGDDDDDETRLLGHVEYLGGKKGALTQAIVEVSRNTWGSLRCVLGDIVQFMLLSSTRYAFLVSADEMMFLKLNAVEKLHYNASNNAVPVFVEPWISFSRPVKFDDVFDERTGKVPVKLALLYMLYRCSQEDWQVEMGIGVGVSYAKKTPPGQDLVVKPIWIR
ncbi:hypothetical protein GQ44DRAFT_609535 [Phaeosphaeriaceae sp. PMI808]|nr:hypothetical protein GQ44DRAFT_609535 [Phaeosphaeriaceae sp. PMI808]